MMSFEDNQQFEVSGILQIFEMPAAWTYLPIPTSKLPAVLPGGWGSIPVVVTIGKTTWRTSLFPLKGANYFLPVKKSVLLAEEIKAGDRVVAKYKSA